MPYVQEIVITTKTKEITKYHSIKCPKLDSNGKTKKEVRQKIGLSTSDLQKKINDRQAAKRLRNLIIENFNANDYFLTLTYAQKPSPEQAKDDTKKFIRRLKSFYKKHTDKKIKYVYITEYGKNGRLHHHLLINKSFWFDIKELTQIWGLGEVDIKIYKGRVKDAVRIANYFIKDQKSGYYTDNQLFKHRYNPSRNLVEPKMTKKIITARTWADKIRVPKGYYLDKDSLITGHTIWGYPYIFYRFIKL